MECFEGTVFGLLIGEFHNSRGCRDTESWLGLLDFYSLPQKALQLSLNPTHLGCEKALGSVLQLLLLRMKIRYV